MINAVYDTLPEAVQIHLAQALSQPSFTMFFSKLANTYDESVLQLTAPQLDNVEKCQQFVADVIKRRQTAELFRAILQLAHKFDPKEGCIMTQIHGQLPETSLPDPIKSSAGSAHTVIREIPQPVDRRLACFDALAETPADITNNANVAAALITFNGFAPTARKIQLLWHEGFSYNAAAGAGPVAVGAMVTIGAGDAIIAADRLTYTDLTAAGTSSSGKPDTIFLSPRNPFVELTLTQALTVMHAIGIRAGFTPTNIVPAFLEVRVIG